jgi:cytochrome c-type biogenesis protein
MPEFNFVFGVSSFVAGLLMFLAPCTLPLVPAYLGFISGVSSKELTDSQTSRYARRKIVLNGFFFVLGFSIVFILFGILASILGQTLVQYQSVVTKIGGVLIIFFGLFMLGVFKLPFLQIEKHVTLPKLFKPGNTLSSFVVGALFSFGWSPCVGPILGSILLVAGTAGTAGQGAFLLFLFSLGMSVPFLLISFFAAKASMFVSRIQGGLKILPIIGGVFLIFLGILLFLGDLYVLIEWGYKLFDFVGYEKLSEFL